MAEGGEADIADCMHYYLESVGRDKKKKTKGLRPGEDLLAPILQTVERARAEEYGPLV
jgi:hypothetical protein